MNKEKFHNALAMDLGYEQMVNDNRYIIIVDDNADDPKVIIKNADGNNLLSFNVSEVEGMKQKCILDNDLDANKKLNKILDAVHQAYIQATTQPF